MLAYEATMDLAVGEVDVQTPLMMTKGTTVVERIGLVPVLRAGLGMVEGFWELMPGAEVWHIGLFRDERTLKPVSYYNRLPVEPTVSVCLVLDPMLATGVGCDDRYLKKWGKNQVCWYLAAPEGTTSMELTLMLHHIAQL